MNPRNRLSLSSTQRRPDTNATVNQPFGTTTTNCVLVDALVFLKQPQIQTNTLWSQSTSFIYRLRISFTAKTTSLKNCSRTLWQTELCQLCSVGRGQITKKLRHLAVSFSPKTIHHASWFSTLTTWIRTQQLMRNTSNGEPTIQSMHLILVVWGHPVICVVYYTVSISIIFTIQRMISLIKICHCLITNLEQGRFHHYVIFSTKRRTGNVYLLTKKQHRMPFLRKEKIKRYFP